MLGASPPRKMARNLSKRSEESMEQRIEGVHGRTVHFSMLETKFPVSTMTNVPPWQIVENITPVQAGHRQI